MDTVPWVDLIAPGGTDDSVCTLVTSFAVSCTPCPDGSSNYWHEQHIETPDTLAIEDARKTYRALQELMPQVEAWLDANPSVPQT